MKAIKLESFEPGNPFWHDSISVGVRLRDVFIGKEKFKKFYLMANSFSTTHDFYIVNSETGERLGIQL